MTFFIKFNDLLQKNTLLEGILYEFFFFSYIFENKDIINMNSQYELLSRKQYIIFFTNIFDINFVLKKFNGLFELKKIKLNINFKLYKNKSSNFFKYLIHFYKIKNTKLEKFNFKYLWYNLYAYSDFWISSYSNLKYAWLLLKSTRSNYFGTFYHTGTLTRFKNPDNISILNKYYNFYNVLIGDNVKFRFPYKLHPYVRNSMSPFCYVWTTCSSGIFNFKKKSKRSKNILQMFKKYFFVYFTHYFQINKIDFLFFKINGFTNLIKFLKKELVFPAKNNFYNLKGLHKMSKKLKKQINAMEKTSKIYPKLLKTVINAFSQHKKIIRDQKKDIIYLDDPIDKIQNESIDEIQEKKNKLFRWTTRIMEYMSRYPKFFYLIDASSYSFNGCRRVRHYK